MNSKLDTSSVLDRVESLRKQLSRFSAAEVSDDDCLSTGCDQLDQLLPGGRLRAGMLVELLAEDFGSGAGALAMHCATRMVDATQCCCVVTDRWRRFYPPAAVARGIETKDLIVVRSSDSQVMSAAEELWALDQALRCAGVGVVVAWLDKVDPRAFRRLQLAAESGKTLALLLRPARVQSLPTWSDVQLLVKPQTGQLQQTGQLKQAVPQGAAAENRFCSVTLLRQRGRAGSGAIEGTSVDLELNEMGTLKGVERRHETRSLHMAPRVAHSANRRRSARA